MAQPLCLLLVEDSADDAELAVRELHRAGYDVTFEVVQTASAYARALGDGQWDVILCDHNLPEFDSIKALRLLQDRQRDIPFIIVSGVIGEEIAVEAMKAGACDYVMKANLARLGPAVQRELKEAEVRRERRRAELALQLSEARLAGVIDSAMDAIISIDSSQCIVLFNPSAQEMFGYTAEEMIGRPIDLLLPQRHRERHRAHIEQFAKTGVSSRTMGDLMTLAALRWNGEEFPIEASISQLEVSGERYFTVILRDVTERARAQQQIAADLREKELLLREVHHRVKNNLQVIASLLSLQADAAADPVVARALLDSEARVRAMGLVHTNLVFSEEAAQIDFGDYLRAFVPQLVKLYGRDDGAVRVVVDAEGAYLGVDAAASMALIVNELVTNALKYAFPENEQGEIRITARPSTREEGPIITVSDTGTGIPPDVVDGHSSFGLQFVATLADQLGYTVQWDTTRGTAVSLVR